MWVPESPPGAAVAALCSSRDRVASQSLKPDDGDGAEKCGRPEGRPLQECDWSLSRRKSWCMSLCLPGLFGEQSSRAWRGTDPAKLGGSPVPALCLPELGQGGQCWCQTAGGVCGPGCWGLCKPIQSAEAGLACHAVSAVGILRVRQHAWSLQEACLTTVAGV